MMYNEMISSEMRMFIGGVLFGALWALAMWGVVENMRSRAGSVAEPEPEPAAKRESGHLYCAVCAGGKYHLFMADNDDFAKRTAEGRYSWLIKVRRATEADREWARRRGEYVPGEPPSPELLANLAWRDKMAKHREQEKPQA